MENHDENFDLKKCLIKNSFEAYVLALETINRITIQYRLETFCYLICNAWELLLKAKILDSKGEIYKKGKTRRTLSLRDCLKRLIPNEKDPIRRNIECVAVLRDESAHLVISQIPRGVMGLFQASVINYHSRLQDWFHESLSDRIPVGMMSIVYDISPEQLNMTDKRLRKRIGRDTATFLAEYCANIKREFDQLQHSPQFSIEIEYKLALTEKTDDADIVLSSGSGDGELTQIVTVPEDPSTSHPFSQTKVIELVNKKISKLPINQYDILCVNKVYKIKSKEVYFYQGKFKNSPVQYSQAFVNWLIKKYREDQQFFINTRDKKKNIAKAETKPLKELRGLL